MIRYTITTHEGRDGVTLSRLGHWGGLPHPTDASATAAATSDAGPASFIITREHVRARRTAR